MPLPSRPTQKVGLVAYADQPFDARTSALAAVDGAEFDKEALGSLQPLGAPLIAQCEQDHVLFWKQNAGAISFIERVAAGKIASFFREHREELAPSSLFRAKVWGRVDESWQLDFVDAGLLPLVEQTAGEDLRNLLERAVVETKSALGWKADISEADGKWLLKSIFWLLAVKILQDKEVPGFIRLDLRELESVYLKLAKHYNKHAPKPVQINGSRRRDALLVAADMIKGFGHCGAVTTESLAWVYESTLIDRATRQKLGTHSTPTWLVDEIVAKLRPWIEEMPVDERRVFEPACGHAGFLISAMRLLSELLPESRVGERKTYLRKRLHGIEVDSFAYEVAKLSLTLADVPNDNGWMLENADMFSADLLQSAISKASIVLANPPFEKFDAPRPPGAMHGRADETFRQIVEALPLHGVFGIVMPQTILHSSQGTELRRKLLNEFELSEITLFADKVFNYGEPETTVILGRRVGRVKKLGKTLYRRVREDRILTYAKTSHPSSEEAYGFDVLEANNGRLFIPELMPVWSILRENPIFGDFVSGGQGFQHKGENDKTLPADAILESESDMPGLVKGFTDWDRLQLTHELPTSKWLNLSPTVIRRPLHGVIVGKRQLLLNYGRVSRGAWRLKALEDKKGHPVTSRFLAFRPLTKEVSLHVLWAICNSPLANAYAYSHSSKRDVLAGTMLQMPVFALNQSDLRPLESAVSAYFEAVKGTRPLATKASTRTKDLFDFQMTLGLSGDHQEKAAAEEELKYLHWRVDAEVLRLYDLPASAERRILDLFTGVRRVGVPFVQDEYFPAGFAHLDRLADLLAITADWTQTNRRRCHLIRKDVKTELRGEEQLELKRLEHLADARITLIGLQQPPEPDEIELTIERLKQEGRWEE